MLAQLSRAIYKQFRFFVTYGDKRCRLSEIITYTVAPHLLTAHIFYKVTTTVVAKEGRKSAKTFQLVFNVYYENIKKMKTFY